MNKVNEIGVTSEFAPLRRVVLTQSEFILPHEENTNDDGSFLEDDVLDMFNKKDTSGKIMQKYSLKDKDNGKKSVHNYKLC